MLHAVIMAGGYGTRFWPKSTEKLPKQFLSLFGRQTMLQATVERIEPLIPAERIWVVTNKQFTNLAAEQLPAIPATNIIGEVTARDTAPCVAVAATLIEAKDKAATMVVLPADHLIEDASMFREVLQQAVKKAETNALVTIGINPRHPETGYGYIEFDPDTENEGAYEVTQFCEKPDEKTAIRFLDAGNFLWNSGMFIWQASTIKNEFKKHLPEIYEQIEVLQEAAGGARQSEAVDVFYRNCPSISIDYGIMERAENVYVIPGRFGWNDVGSWKAYYELSQKDEHGNVLNTTSSIINNANNNLVYSRGKKIIALSDVNDIAIIETENAILICNKDKTQNVKQIVNKLRERDDLRHYL